MEEATVDCLINPDTRSWNHEMIDGIFIPLEADLIKKIHLSKNAIADWVFWPLVQNGQYSRKSGYWFLKEEEAGFSIDEPPVYEQKLWKNIWSLDVPNKVKHFTWRACKTHFQQSVIWFAAMLII